MIDLIRHIVEDELGVSLNEENRKRPVMDAKKIFCKLIKTYTKLSLPKIGKLTNNNHATVIHHLKKFDALYEFDKDFKFKFDRCFLRLSNEKNK